MISRCLESVYYTESEIYIYFCQEREIQSLSAEIESLKNPQNLNSSERLDELQEENARLKYRINILKRVSDTALNSEDGYKPADCRQIWGLTNMPQRIHLEKHAAASNAANSKTHNIKRQTRCKCRNNAKSKNTQTSQQQKFFRPLGRA